MSENNENKEKEVAKKEVKKTTKKIAPAAKKEEAVVAKKTVTKKAEKKTVENKEKVVEEKKTVAKKATPKVAKTEVAKEVIATTPKTKTTKAKKEEANEPVVIAEVKKEKVKKEKIKKERVPFKVFVAEHKPTVIITSIVVGLLLILGILLGVFLATDGNKKAVEYNGGYVTKAVYETYYKLFGPILQYYYGYPDEATIKEEIANKSALDALLLAEIKEKGIDIKVTEEEKQSLEEQLSDKDLIDNYKEQGINIDVLRQLFYEDIRITKYLEYMKNQVTDEKAREYAATKEGFVNKDDLNKYETRHILFSLASDATDEKKAEVEKKANEVLARIKNGEKIEDLAKEFSEDTGSKNDGGKVDMYSDGSFLKEYETAVKMLQEGSVTEHLVKTSAGYHIIKLDKIVPEGRLDKIKDEIVNNQLEELQTKSNIKPNASVIAEVK